MSFTPELSHDQTIEQDMRQEWRQSPLQEMSGIEVFENMVEVHRGQEISPERRYKQLRHQVLTPPFDKVTVVSALARTGSAKSSLMIGFHRLFNNDVWLRDELDKQGVDFIVQSLPFAMAAEAVKSPGVAQTLPEFAIPPERQHGTYTEDEYRKISSFMQYLIDTRVLAAQGSGTASVLLLEPSSTTAVPIRTEDTIETVGIDRGLSPLYRLAGDSETMGQVTIFALEREPVVAQETIVFRSGAADKTILSPEIFAKTGEVVVVYTEPDESDDDTQAEDLTSATQEKVREFLLTTMAPPQAQARSDAEFDSIKAHIVAGQGYRVDSDRQYFRHIQETLGISDARFHYLKNPYFSGRKTIDLNYFLGSLPRQYMGISTA